MIKIREGGKETIPKTLCTDDNDIVRISPLINVPYNLLTHELELRYSNWEHLGLVINEKMLNKYFDAVEDISFIDYNREEGKFEHHYQVYKSKNINYFVVIDIDLNTSYDDDNFEFKKGVYKLHAIAYDSTDHELCKNTEVDLNKHFKPRSNNSSQISIVLKTTSGYVFKPHKIKPLTLDIDTMYNDDFADVHDHIVESLKGTQKGIVLLHGKAGTGKTNYIKYLTTLVPDKKFVFIPVSMIPYLADASFLSSLIDNKGSILVLEDSETFLKDRGTAENSVVSTILNLSDGMLSDVLGIQIICTFNADLESVDEALLRKGRLIDEYKFDELDTHKAQSLADNLKLDTKINKPMTLAEVMNLNDKSHRNKKSANKIGFR